MAEERTSSSIEINHLYAFFDQLRASGYKIDTGHYVALSDLVLHFVADDGLKDYLSLKTKIAPLICSSPSEQEDFYDRFDVWVSNLSSRKQIKLSGEKATSLPQRRQSFSVIYWLLVGVVLISFFLLNDPVSVFSKYLQWVRTDWINTVFWFGIVAIILWGFRLVWMFYQRNQFITRKDVEYQPVYKKIPVDIYSQKFFPIEQSKRVAKVLRHRSYRWSTHVDVEKTIGSFFKNGDWIDIAYHVASRVPEYVVLIDRKSRLDQQAHLTHLTLSNLAHDGVLFHFYEFRSDPKICFKFDDRSSALSLDEVRARHPYARLFVFIDAYELRDPFKGGLYKWIDSLLFEQHSAVFSFVNLPQELIDTLLSKKILVFPPSLPGLLSAGQSYQENHISKSNQIFSFFPKQLLERSSLWTARNTPESTDILDLLNDLHLFLGQDGFYWLCATAVYPELHWELTLLLGATLENNHGNILFSLDTLYRLLSLPWFRFGYQPNWLRHVLVDRLSKGQEAAVRDVLSRLLLSAYSGEEFELVFSRKELHTNKRFLRKAMRKFARSVRENNEFRDQTLVDFVLGKKNRKLSVSLPNTLQAQFSRTSINISTLKIEEQLQKVYSSFMRSGKSLQETISSAPATLLNGFNNYYRDLRSRFISSNKQRERNKRISDNLNHIKQAGEYSIALWGPAGSGKTAFIYAFARKLAIDYRDDPDFLYQLTDAMTGDLISIYLPEVHPTESMEDFSFVFQRIPKKITPSHETSSFEHIIHIRDNKGADTISIADDYYEMSRFNITSSSSLIIMLDPTFDYSSTNKSQSKKDFLEDEFLEDDFLYEPNPYEIHSMSGDEYYYRINQLFSVLRNEGKDRHFSIAVCITKIDSLNIRNRDPWELIRIFFGGPLYDMLQKYQSLPNFTIQTFSISSFGFLGRKPNFDPVTNDLKNQERWLPYNVEAPLFWLFDQIERRRLAEITQRQTFIMKMFTSDLSKHYIPYKIKRR